MWQKGDNKKSGNMQAKEGSNHDSKRFTVGNINLQGKIFEITSKDTIH
jgi:hypothetical protein